VATGYKYLLCDDSLGHLIRCDAQQHARGYLVRSSRS
jgi:hypothetical protein